MRYPAKILLFGEYTVLKGSPALAIAFDGYGAEWKFAKSANSFSLPAFATYLRQHFSTQEIDTIRFKAELDRHLYLQSDIPEGYGVGSSGAVCAAVLDRFGSEVTKAQSLPSLRSVFSRMESFFHGSSSGLDPLVCYLRQGLKLLEDGTFELVQSPVLTAHQLFLLDTGQPRETEPLVAYFETEWQNDSFRTNVEKGWMPTNKIAIDSYLSAADASLWDAFTRISHYQFCNLLPMIPQTILPIWEKGLNGDIYRLKICGAGGGGFMLGITQKSVDLSRLFGNYKTIQIH